MLLLAGTIAAAPSQSSPEINAAAVVRRAVSNRLSADAKPHLVRFIFHKKDERRDFVQKIIETRQGDVALLVAVNGKPIPPAARQLETNRLDNLAAHPELQAHRQKREQEDQARVEMLLKLLPDAFTYHYDGTGPCNVRTVPTIVVAGAPAPAPAPAAPAVCYHMTFVPSPSFDPPNMEARILRGMAGDIWIEAGAERLYRLNAHLVSDVDFGWGIVGRLNRGGTVFLEQNEVAPEDWELTRMRLNLTGKALLVKTLSFHIDEEESAFAPVPADMDYRTAIRLLESEQPK